ncbi:MAG TPA: DNA helicase, partial [Chromatiales bacterium]|nr:DNA helicase [Chromatiales bacterium]
MPDPVIQVIPCAGDPLADLADSLLNTHRERLPDLSAITVLLPDPSAAPALRRCLLEGARTVGVTALLGPRIRTLRDWAMEHLPAGIRVCDPQRQRLILVAALREHPELVRSANPWALADDLLVLFDELTLNRVELPPDPDDFVRQLEAAYGVEQAGISALGQEATLVFTLWHAWHNQLQGMGLTDGQAAYLLALSRSLDTPREAASLYLAGFTGLKRAETDWLRQLLDTGQARLWLHGQAGALAGPDLP